MSEEAGARLDAMTDEEITAAAMSDPDNPPLTDDELLRLRAVRIARRARAVTQLSQAQFAETFGIKVARLRDLEQGRVQPDQVLVSLLAMIADDPDRARRILKSPYVAGAAPPALV